MECLEKLRSLRQCITTGDVSFLTAYLPNAAQLYVMTALYLSLEQEKFNLSQLISPYNSTVPTENTDTLLYSAIVESTKYGEETTIFICIEISPYIPYKAIQTLWECSMITVLSELIHNEKPIKGFELEHIYSSTFSAILQYAFDSKQNQTRIDQLIFKSRKKLTDETLEMIIRSYTDIKIMEVSRILPERLCYYQYSLLCSIELRKYMYIYECGRDAERQKVTLKSNVVYQLIENIRKDFKAIELYLYLCLVFIKSFNETTIVKLLDILENIFLTDDSSNSFMNSVGNFLKVSMLTIELLNKIKSKSFSVYRCNQILKEIMSITTAIISTVENEETMASLLFDKDLFGRSTLNIISINGIDVLMDHLSIQSIINKIWNGAKSNGLCMQSQSFLTKALLAKSYSEDMEHQYRNLQNRNKLQHSHRYSFSAWKNGMHLKYLSNMTVYLVILVVSLIYLERIFTISKLGHTYHIKMRNLQTQYDVCQPPTDCTAMKQEIDSNDVLALEQYSMLYEPFIGMIAIIGVNFLCIFTHIISVVHCRLCKIKYLWSPYSIIDYLHSLCALLAFILYYFQLKDKSFDTDMQIRYQNIVKIASMYGGMEMYISINLSLLILKIIYMFRINQVLGPFLNSFNWVFVETVRFIIIYIFVLLLFSIVLSMIFYLDIDGAFQGLGVTILTLIPISFTNIDFTITGSSTAGMVFILVFILIVGIIFMNLLIGIAGMNYTKFYNSSNQKIYSESIKILSQNTDNSFCRASVSGIFPFSIPFAIISFICFPFKSKRKSIDALLLKIQYVMILLPIVILYFLYELIIVVPAYFKLMLIKLITIFSAGTLETKKTKTYEFATYLTLGIAINCYYAITDTLFFSIDCINRNEQSLEQITICGPFSISKLLLKQVTINLRDYRSKGLEYILLSTMIKDIEKILHLERKDKLKILQLFWCPNPKYLISEQAMDTNVIKNYLLLISTLRSNSVICQGRSYIHINSLYSIISSLMINTKLAKCNKLLKRRGSAELTQVALLESTRVVPEELVNIKLLHHIKDCMISKGIQKYLKSKPSQKISEELIKRIQTIK